MTLLLETSQQLEVALGRAIVRGHRLKDLLVVEFCDCSDAEGFFRKYAAFIIESEIIPRSLAHGRSWMIKHTESEFTPSMIQGEGSLTQGHGSRWSPGSIPTARAALPP